MAEKVTRIVAQIVDAICEGPIEGFPTADSSKFIYVDGTRLRDLDDTISIETVKFDFAKGTADQTPSRSYTSIGDTEPSGNTNFVHSGIAGEFAKEDFEKQIQIRDDTSGSFPLVQSVQFTLSMPEGAYRTANSDGDIKDRSVKIKIWVNPTAAKTSGAWIAVREVTIGSGKPTSTYEESIHIEIPPIWLNRNSAYADEFIWFKIERLSEDDNSNRHHSEFYVKDYTKYANNIYSYPYTAYVGMTIDSDDFSNIPRRNYELKLLKVQVPVNYDLVFDADGNVIERKYTGTWNGTFKTMWTDNPAWCFYDLCTNKRYGLGEYLSANQVDKWALYNIAKYCDAVVSVGGGVEKFYLDKNTPANSIGGVDDGFGNKEPRYTCNILITDAQEAFNVVQAMASIFRGIVYFHQNELQVLQDRPVYPLYTFNNTNVIEGTFNYSGSSVKARHTTAKIAWLDPGDLYAQKTEYVEDIDGIARFGVRPLDLNAVGCTSRGQARRVGLWALITEKFETETVSFKVGLDGAIVYPGNTILIQDSNRKTARLGGRIVSATSNTITVDSPTYIDPAQSYGLLVVLNEEMIFTNPDGSTESSLVPKYHGSSIVESSANPSILYTTFTLNTPFTGTLPVAGNIWMLSSALDSQRTFKVLSVVENGTSEFEITALEHEPTKYTQAESGIIFNLPKEAANTLTPAVPTSVTLSHKVNRDKGKVSIDLTIAWVPAGTYQPGDMFDVYLKENEGAFYLVQSKVEGRSILVRNVSEDTYWAKVVPINVFGRRNDTGTIGGPHYATDQPPLAVTLDFDLDPSSKDVIASWEIESYGFDYASYELWGMKTQGLTVPPALETSLYSNNIGVIDENNNTVYIQSFNKDTVINDLIARGVIASAGEFTTAHLKDYRLRSELGVQAGYTESGTTTSVVKDTGVFNDVKVGDLFYNSTIGNYAFSYVTKVVSVNQIEIDPPIPGQTSGQNFYISSGFYHGEITALVDGYGYDGVVVKNLTGLYVGQDCDVLRMNGYFVGKTGGTTLTDGALDPLTQYTYWLRTVSPNTPTLVSNWLPSDAGKVTTTLAAGGDAFKPYWTWHFKNSTEGWGIINGAYMLNTDSIMLISTGSNPIFDSKVGNAFEALPAITGTSKKHFPGGTYPLIKIRIKRVAGTGWSGFIFPELSYRPYIYQWKMIPDTTILGEFVDIVVDMSVLTDYNGNTLDVYLLGNVYDLRFDFGNSPEDVFEIDYIAIGNNIGPDGAADQNADNTAEKQFSPIISWEFRNSLEGWAAGGATTLLNSDSVTLVSAGGDPVFNTTPEAWNILPTQTKVLDGTVYNILRFRARRLAGTGWQGAVYFTRLNSAPTVYTEAFQKSITNVFSEVESSEWKIVELDMSALSVGGNAWATATDINGLRLDLGASEADRFEIDWIAIGKYSAATNGTGGNTIIEEGDTIVQPELGTGSEGLTMKGWGSLFNNFEGSMLQYWGGTYALRKAGAREESTGKAIFPFTGSTCIKLLGPGQGVVPGGGGTTTSPPAAGTPLSNTFSIYAGGWFGSSKAFYSFKDLGNTALISFRGYEVGNFAGSNPIGIPTTPPSASTLVSGTASLDKYSIVGVYDYLGPVASANYNTGTLYRRYIVFSGEVPQSAISGLSITGKFYNGANITITNSSISHYEYSDSGYSGIFPFMGTDRTVFGFDLAGGLAETMVIGENYSIAINGIASAQVDTPTGSIGSITTQPPTYETETPSVYLNIPEQLATTFSSRQIKVVMYLSTSALSTVADQNAVEVRYIWGWGAFTSEWKTIRLDTVEEWKPYEINFRIPPMGNIAVSNTETMMVSTVGPGVIEIRRPLSTPWSTTYCLYLDSVGITVNTHSMEGWGSIQHHFDPLEDWVGVDTLSTVDTRGKVKAVIKPVISESAGVLKIASSTHAAWGGSSWKGFWASNGEAPLNQDDTGSYAYPYQGFSGTTQYPGGSIGTFVHFDKKGVLHRIWQEQYYPVSWALRWPTLNNEINTFYTKSTDLGKTWARPTQLAPVNKDKKRQVSSALYLYPLLVVSPDEKHMVVLSEYYTDEVSSSPTTNEVYMQLTQGTTDGGNTWFENEYYYAFSTDTPVPGLPNVHFSPTAGAVTNDGTIYAMGAAPAYCWVTGLNPTVDIDLFPVYVGCSTNKGATWSTLCVEDGTEYFLICSEGYYNCHTSLLVTDNGDVHILYWCGKYPYDKVYLRHATVNFSTGTMIKRTVVELNSGNFGYKGDLGEILKLVSDDSGAIYAFYERTTAGDPYTNTIYCCKFKDGVWDTTENIIHVADSNVWTGCSSTIEYDRDTKKFYLILSYRPDQSAEYPDIGIYSGNPNTPGLWSLEHGGVREELVASYGASNVNMLQNYAYGSNSFRAGLAGSTKPTQIVLNNGKLLLYSALDVGESDSYWADVVLTYQTTLGNVTTYLTIPEQSNNIFQGKEIEMSIVAKQSSTAPASSSFGIQYDYGDSRSQIFTFTPTTAWNKFTALFEVPFVPLTSTEGKFIIYPDAGNTEGTVPGAASFSDTFDLDDFAAGWVSTAFDWDDPLYGTYSLAIDTSKVIITPTIDSGSSFYHYLGKLYETASSSGDMWAGIEIAAPSATGLGVCIRGSNDINGDFQGYYAFIYADGNTAIGGIINGIEDIWQTTTGIASAPTSGTSIKLLCTTVSPTEVKLDLYVDDSFIQTYVDNSLLILEGSPGIFVEVYENTSPGTSVNTFEYGGLITATGIGNLDVDSVSLSIAGVSTTNITNTTIINNTEAKETGSTGTNKLETIIINTDYTVTDDADNKYINCISDTPVNIIVPVLENIETGARIHFVPTGTGRLTYVAQAGVRIFSPGGVLTSGVRYGEQWLTYVGANDWMLGGEIPIPANIILALTGTVPFGISIEGKPALSRYFTLEETAKVTVYGKGVLERMVVWGKFNGIPSGGIGYGPTNLGGILISAGITESSEKWRMVPAAIFPMHFKMTVDSKFSINLIGNVYDNMVPSVIQSRSFAGSVTGTFAIDGRRGFRSLFYTTMSASVSGY